MCEMCVAEAGAVAAEAVAEAVNNFLSTRKEKKQNSVEFLRCQ